MSAWGQFRTRTRAMARSALPLRTDLVGSTRYFQKCQKPKWHALFDHLVGPSKQHGRNTQSNRSGRLEVDPQSESGWQFDRQIRRLSAPLRILSTNVAHWLDAASMSAE